MVKKILEKRLTKLIDTTLTERHGEYGDFSDVTERLTHTGTNPISFLCAQITVKLLRSHNSSSIDSYVDIAGYFFLLFVYIKIEKNGRLAPDDILEEYHLQASQLFEKWGVRQCINLRGAKENSIYIRSMGIDNQIIDNSSLEPQQIMSFYLNDFHDSKPHEIEMILLYKMVFLALEMLVDAET